MNNTAAHQKLAYEILEKVGSHPNIRLWIRVVGFDRLKKIRYGIPGEADLQGIAMPNGRMIAIEVKTGSGKLSVEQKRYRDMILRFGGVHILARSVEQVLTELQNHLGFTFADTKNEGGGVGDASPPPRSAP